MEEYTKKKKESTNNKVKPGRGNSEVALSRHDAICYMCVRSMLYSTTNNNKLASRSDREREREKDGRI